MGSLRQACPKSSPGTAGCTHAPRRNGTRTPRAHFRSIHPRAVVCLLAAWLCLGGGGCQSIIRGVNRNADVLSAWWESKSYKPDDMSDQTWDLLRLWDMDGRSLNDRQATIAMAARTFRTSPDREWACALAELTHREAQRLEHRSPAAAARWHLDSLTYAWHFLFADQTPLNAFDQRTAYACRLYNIGLERCLALSTPLGGCNPRDGLWIAMAGGAVAAPAGKYGFSPRARDFDELLLAKNYTPADYIPWQKVFGLGVPMLGIRRTATRTKGEPLHMEQHPVAITAVLKPDLSRIVDHDEQTSASEPRRLDENVHTCGRLELYDPLHVADVQVADRAVPLQSDLGAPMSYVLQGINTRSIEWSGFFEPDEVEQFTRLYSFEPYQKGKIPVVFVHGLFSGPVTWTEMFEDLWNDPTIRENYQFLFFLYPTGNPFLESARQLRAELEHIASAHADDPAARQMVLVGHSMGGLISKLQVTESGDRLWNLVSPQPLAQLKADSQTRTDIQQTFFFEPQPAVSRVVFIATPHLGSQIGKAPLARLGSSLVAMPRSVRRLNDKLHSENPQAKSLQFDRAISNSVEELASDSPILRAMYELPFKPGVRLHSIVGTLDESVVGRSSIGELLVGHTPQEGDGVVSLVSAELPTDDSEFFVPASHSKVHRHPLAFQEVRRVLIEQLRARTHGVQPLGDAGPELTVPTETLQLQPRSRPLRKESAGVEFVD